jgi:hypothetical protein
MHTLEMQWLEAAAWTAAIGGLTHDDAARGLSTEHACCVQSQLDSWFAACSDAHSRAQRLAAQRAIVRSSAAAPSDDDEKIERQSQIGAVVIASLIAHTPPSIRAAVARIFAPDALRLAAPVAHRVQACNAIKLRVLVEQCAQILKSPPQAHTLGALVESCFAPVEDALETSRRRGGLLGPPADVTRLLCSLRARAVDYRGALKEFEGMVA